MESRSKLNFKRGFVGDIFEGGVKERWTGDIGWSNEIEPRLDRNPIKWELFNEGKRRVKFNRIGLNAVGRVTEGFCGRSKHARKESFDEYQEKIYQEYLLHPI